MSESRRPSRTPAWSSPDNVYREPGPGRPAQGGPCLRSAHCAGSAGCFGAALPEWVEGALVVGELSLDGSVRHVRGVLPMAALARQEKFGRLFVPAEDAAEAALIPGIEVIPVGSLTALVNHLSGVVPVSAFDRATLPFRFRLWRWTSAR